MITTLAMMFALSLQERTAASAHQFLGEAFLRNVEISHRLTVEEYLPGGCVATIKVRNKYHGTRSEMLLDFGRIGDIHTNYISGGADIKVPVLNEGTESNNLYVSFGSDQLRDRAVSAMMFLRDGCDSSRSTGF